MAAVAKAALAEKRTEFDEGAGQRRVIEMLQREFLQAGGVDQCGVGVEAVQARVGGGMATAVERFGVFAGRDCGVRTQRIDQGGLAHAGLPDQQGGVTQQMRQ